jgi:hypothetical protein
MLDEAQQRFLRTDLPYELDALEVAYLVVTSSELARFRSTPALNNLFIENFWLHARNLTECFETTSKSDSTVSPMPFTNGTYKTPETQKRLRDIINAQITHLQRERGESAKQNLASKMHYVFHEIRKAADHFEASLFKESQDYWRAREPMTADDVIKKLSPSGNRPGGSKLVQANTTTHVERYGFDFPAVTGPTRPA